MPNYLYAVTKKCYYGDAENVTCMRDESRHNRINRSEPFTADNKPSALELIAVDGKPVTAEQVAEIEAGEPEKPKKPAQPKSSK